MTGAFPGSLPSTISRTETDMRERLCAFLYTLADRTDAQAELLAVAGSDPPDARFRGPLHLAMLLGRIRPGADTAYLAGALLAPLAANPLLYRRRTRGMPLDRVKAGLDALTANLVRGLNRTQHDPSGEGP